MQVAIDKLSTALRCCPHFDLLRKFCKTSSAYVVGGAIRDALLGRPISDLDLIFPEDPTSLAKAFARQVGGHWFWLDRQRRQSRVVVNSEGVMSCYDFALFRAPDLKGDLLDRDFTINAMALPLDGDLSVFSMVDPCLGLQALQQNSLQVIATAAFTNDPLRIIKGVRHATSLGVDVEAETLRAMKDAVKGLSLVAPERIRQEIWKILSDKQASRGLRLLHECGGGEQLFGAGFAKSLQDLIDRLTMCRAQWQALAVVEPSLSDWLAGEVEQGLSRETLLLFTQLLSAIDPGMPAAVANRWLLSRRAKAGIAAVVALDEDKLREFASIAQTQRAYALWAVRCRIEPKLLLLALAVGPRAFRPSPDAIRSCAPRVAGLDGSRPRDLVDGQWLRSELCLKEGPAMSKTLEQLRNAEMFGKVCNGNEARQYLKRYCQNRD